MSNYHEKYLKYKAKYLALRNQHGGTLINVQIIRMIGGEPTIINIDDEYHEESK